MDTNSTLPLPSTWYAYSMGVLMFVLRTLKAVMFLSVLLTLSSMTGSPLQYLEMISFGFNSQIGHSQPRSYRDPGIDRRPT